jgi:fructuronate reductase
MTKLNSKMLAERAANYAVPTRDLAKQRVGIVHIGPGAFHRSHQALATELCLEAGEDDWGICSVSLRSATFARQIAAQDGLYSLMTRSENQDDLRVIGAISKSLSMQSDWAEVAQTLVAPNTRIVTLTVTEKGYGADVQTRRLDVNDPSVAHDLQHPNAQPQSVAGLLVQAIMTRAANGTAQFTCLSCDNLHKNGALLQTVLLDFARAQGLVDVEKIISTMSFPSSMVDRITPATTTQDIANLQTKFGYSDDCLVVAEPFFQWVIEDDFALGRPNWDAAGVEFVADVTGHELMKLRMLNGAHTILAAIGQTVGTPTIAQTIRISGVATFLETYWSQVAQTLPEGLDHRDYAQKLLLRFQNPALEHRVAQIASDVSKKITQRLIAPFEELDGQASALGLGLALVVRACGLRDELGHDIIFSDPDIGNIIPRVDFLEIPNMQTVTQITGATMGGPQITDWLKRLQRDGVVETLNQFNQENN